MLLNLEHFGFLILLFILEYSEGEYIRPNVVIIVADDMFQRITFNTVGEKRRGIRISIRNEGRKVHAVGVLRFEGWDDVSFHGSDQILTPNIDLLAYTGVALERYYSHCICTPSRSALLTGKFAYVTGMQGYPLTNAEDRGLPITEKILPQYFKEAGYATHLVGKWHVGQSRKEYLPTYRGFDSHFGHRGGYIDYYEYNLLENWSIGDVSGFDLFRNETAAWDVEGYITDIYNEEAKSIIKSHDVSKPLFLMVGHNAPHSANEGALMQAPPDIVRAMGYIDLPQRRYYAAMVKKLDDSVGDIVKALLDKGILENSIVVFISDNGGMTTQEQANYASNWPLRGLKMTPFEGGIRVNGLIWAKNLTKSEHLWKGYMHVSDWTPTILSAVGIKPPTDIDGVNLWETIQSNGESKRDLIVEIDDYTGFAAIIKGDYKLITGTVKTKYSNHQGHIFKGITRPPPLYKDAIKNSAMYSILSDIGIDFKMSDIETRNKIKVKCNEIKGTEYICYPSNGKWCLFNIKEDPCESQDLSSEHPEIANKLYSRLQIEIKRTIPRKVPHEVNLKSKPSLYNNTWDVWHPSEKKT